MLLPANHKVLFVFSALALWVPQSYAQQVPDAYESTPGRAQALNGTSTAYGVGDMGSVQTNPALLYTTPSYEFSAAYHWPSTGREFYKTGVIDTKTKKLATAIVYTGSLNKLQNTDVAINTDSKISQKIQAGFARSFGKFSFGISAQYVEGQELNENSRLAKTKGFNFGAGLYTKFSSNLSIGASAEGIGSKKMKNLSPKTYRAGISYKLSPKWIANADFKQRSRTPEEFLSTKPERMGFLSIIYKYQNKLELLGSYGKEFSPENGNKSRESLSAGATIQMEKMKVGYTLRKPYMRLSEKHQSIHVSFAIKM